MKIIYGEPLRTLTETVHIVLTGDDIISLIKGQVLCSGTPPDIKVYHDPTIKNEQA